MFLPFLIKRMGWGLSTVFFALTGFFTLIAYIPLFNIEILQNLLSSVGLYINSFEFNGSIYYLLRSIGYVIVGFNLIHILGKSTGSADAWRDTMDGMAGEYIGVLSSKKSF